MSQPMAQGSVVSSGTLSSATVLGTVPSSAHGVHYATIVREKSLLRQLISASNDILRDAYGPQEQAELVVRRHGSRHGEE